MGSSPGDSIRPADEQPHQVTISRAFYMQATEVTNAQFQTQHPAHAAPLWLNTIELNQKNHPAIYMSWNIAEQFCRDLATPIDKMQGHYRLPTEAEWEWACRAEATTATPWGDSTKDVAPHANFLDPNSHSYWSRLAPTAAGKDYIATQTPIEADDGHLGTAPVRSFAPNRWGLYDMLGNAAEWCQDWYSPTYPDTPQQDPMGPVSGQHKVSRGGGFYSSRVSARSSSRSGRLPLGHKRSQGLGFRLVFAPSTLPKKP